MFDKILIANRGEIACRVIRTARRMGIGTVAVYSDADRDALHVEMADEAVWVGEAPSAQSYLRTDRIVEACLATGAQAVHPGYGFLSENAQAARAFAAAGVVFIGPPIEAIAAMGDKITSKRIAAEAGVSTIPGHPDAVADADEAVEVARAVGYPVMIKATAGGGGKGMRIAHDDAECRDGFERATSEARSSFGDDRVFIERFIERPRHIEIQILADGHGNALYLGERECSLQRRHQKVIEEAPSPLLDEATRRAMGEQAVALARAVGYRSAGTVEFVADPNRNFYFLEMNTRLQVEHPVTELITGLDLVEQMIRVAAGEALALRQEEVRLRGWAMEARVYAEDPERGFLPSTGRLVRYRPPMEAPDVRIDTGVVEGGEVSMFYDPMIAKVITHGEDRDTALRRLQWALDELQIRGPAHNTAFLAALARHPRFARGDLGTDFIAQEFGDAFEPGLVPDDELRVLVAVAATVHARMDARDRRSGAASGVGHRAALRNDWVVVRGREARWTVRVQPDDGPWRAIVDGHSHEVLAVWRPGDQVFRGKVDDREVCVAVDRVGVGYRLSHAGYRVDLLVLSPRAAELHRLMPERRPPDLSRFVLSPMPGLLVRVSVAAGDTVKAGQELAVVEAMKMENVLRAPQDHVVKAVLAQPGASLAVDQPIVEFE
ncbi:MAG: acetyl/propionyl/methylcrotonyl-CoA carboxylase subunit alpha [Ectothiorhodospiraceae bacterium]|nr:acetyl/propionyl/methylcrotonyl-CoA carboxylase subunit alpha [Chromatiales bacterium]MCP5156712.1 acetyl/propionyl/methylcrotonyl-CoA carboxylase subunit alpha [Ectothiorhodospiraceae bacterium]